MKTILTQAQMNFVIVNQKQKIRIPTQNIIMLEGHNNYTLFYLQNGKQRMYARTIGHFQELLDSEQFIRIHRGFLVNSSCIVGYDKVENKLQPVFRDDYGRIYRVCFVAKIDSTNN
jgi:DNA-binding LytR/AlgR family response regulator